VAQVPVEILTSGQFNSDDLHRAVTTANTVQSEFSYSFFPEEAQAQFRAYAVGHLKVDDALDQIEAARTSEGGYHPFCLGFIDGEVLGRDGFANIFGSDRPASGLAVFTTHNVPDIIIPKTRLSAYFLYYLAKSALSFRAPNHKNHSDDRGCPYDAKLNKRAIVESMRARALCTDCRSKLRAVAQLTARQILALETIFASCGDLLREDPNEQTSIDPRPSVFIGSSAEGLKIARKLKQLLSKDLRIEIWDEGHTFGLGQATLESLEAAVVKYDFGLFVFTPDDKLRSRGKVKPVARDNVLFELGLFVGKLTRRRAFVIRPTGQAIALPSDLAGITTATYPFGSVDRDGAKHLSNACAQVIRAVRAASVSEG
jgi:predicted nucleotide-binding protein